MLYAGIDIAKYDHVVGAVDERGWTLSKPMAFKNSSSGFERCAAYLAGIADDKSQVVVGMEATGHYWLPCFCFLTGKGYSVVVINPMRTDAMRRFKNLGKVKTDAIDRALIAETLRCGDFEPSRLADEKLVSLRQLTRLHQSMVESAADLKRQVIVALDQVFPEYSGLFSDIFGESSKAFLKRCPTPEEVAAIDIRTLTSLLDRASRGKLGRGEGLVRRHGRRRRLLLPDQAPRPADRVRRGPGGRGGEEGEGAARRGRAADRHDPRHLPQARRPDRRRDRRRGQVQERRRHRQVRRHQPVEKPIRDVRFEGEANHITKQGSPYLRRALYLAATAQLKCKTPLYDYYLRKRGEGKAHREATVAVARKLVHVIYAVLSKQEPYDPAYAAQPPASRSERIDMKVPKCDSNNSLR